MNCQRLCRKAIVTQITQPIVRTINRLAEVLCTIMQWLPYGCAVNKWACSIHDWGRVRGSFDGGKRFVRSEGIARRVRSERDQTNGDARGHKSCDKIVQGAMRIAVCLAFYRVSFRRKWSRWTIVSRWAAFIRACNRTKTFAAPRLNELHNQVSLVCATSWRIY